MNDDIVFLSHDQLITSNDRKDNLIVIIPGEDCLLTTVDMPKMSRDRFLKALPFALEEKLIDDVNQLHFAIGEEKSGASRPVVIIAKEKMDYYQKQLNHFGLSPNQMIPVTLALPYSSDHWYALVYNHLCYVRTGQYAGFICDSENISFYLSSKINKLNNSLAGIHIYNFSDQPIDLKQNPIINEIRLPDHALLQYLKEWLGQNASIINLLQGPYRTTYRSKVSKKIWTWTALLASISALFIFTSQIISLFILKEALAKTENSINVIYKHHFPQSTTVVAPRERLEAKLKKLSNETGQHNFLTLLGLISQQLTATSDIHIQQFEFHDNQLNLMITASSFANVDHFIQALTTAHLIVKQQSADLLGTVIQANLLITPSVTGVI